ncbi:MAG: ComF family protein [Thermodesulfovibrionales bacterium]
MQGLASWKLGFLSKILKFLYPSKCPACNNDSSHQFYPFCMTCWDKIMPFNGHRCSVCSIPLPSHSSICGDCIQNRPFFKSSFIYGLYDGILKEAIHQLKYSGLRNLASPLSGLLLELSFPEADLIVPVPPDRYRLKNRGFNHTSLIARELSKRLKIPLIIDGLIKIKTTPQQINLKREERLKNLRGAFRAIRSFSGQRILLVDDVITSGATASECARALIKAGASEVYLVAIARSAGEREFVCK